MPRISLIAAVAENGVIGRDNHLPWHLPNDLKYFRAVTLGHPVILGRKNYESIGRPLPGRENIVLSTDPAYRAPGCRVVPSLEAALALTEKEPEVFIIGGATLYRQALPLVQRLYLTRVHAQVEGDVFFPEWDPSQWRELRREDHRADARHAYDYSFLVYERKRNA